MDANETNFLRCSGGENGGKLTKRRISCFPEESLQVDNYWPEYVLNILWISKNLKHTPCSIDTTFKTLKHLEFCET